MGIVGVVCGVFLYYLWVAVIMAILFTFFAESNAMGVFTPHSPDLGCHDGSPDRMCFFFQMVNGKIFISGSLIILLDANGCQDQNDQRH
jgi:hypothetical protein